MKIQSPAFQANQDIPEKYTCQGQDINPPLEIQGVPSNAKSLALVMDDPDAPMGTWDHWIVYNIPPSVSRIEENTVPGKEALNSWKKTRYGGPCPPSGTHRYFFKLYALDSNLDLPQGADKARLTAAMKNHILAQSELVCLYQKR